MPQQARTIEYYKKELAKQRKQTAYAWGRYYDITERFHELHTEIYNQLTEAHIPPDDVKETNTEHLNKYVSKLYEKAKEQVECSICLEVINSKDLEITKCGHTFHKTCMTQLKKSSNQRYVDCPICRTKIWNDNL